MSSRVKLSLLVDHINGFPSIDLELKFKILQSAARGARPPLSSHVSESFFSFDVSAEELKKLGRRSLRSKVDSAFEHKVSAYVDGLLIPTNLPEDVLYFILPYIYGGKDCLTDKMLEQIVATAKKLLAEASPTRTRRAAFKSTGPHHQKGVRKRIRE